MSNLYLHGPEGSIDIIEATRNFLNLDDLAVKEANITKPFSDHTMAVTYVPIKNLKAKNECNVPVVSNINAGSINYYDYGTNSNGKRNRSPSPKKIVRAPSNFREGRVDGLMNYVCKIHAKVGALDVEKCHLAGVTPGPDLGKLKAGEDITLPNGTVVRSADVVYPSHPGSVFIGK